MIGGHLDLCGQKQKNGHGVLVHGTLKCFVSQKWSDEFNVFLSCWYTFKKTYCFLNNFLVAMVKNGLLK